MLETLFYQRQKKFQSNNIPTSLGFFWHKLCFIEGVGKSAVSHTMHGSRVLIGEVRICIFTWTKTNCGL